MIPATGRKKEYHRRVSPIVRNGGRSSEIHIPRMKAKNKAMPVSVQAYTSGLRSFQAKNAPAAHKRTAVSANQTNESQLMISSV